MLDHAAPTWNEQPVWKLQMTTLIFLKGFVDAYMLCKFVSIGYVVLFAKLAVSTFSFQRELSLSIL